uniref:Oxysterol-binding protein n=1 Tax=Electrophorus electricus TaxID=8005 RepID=A0A4W4DV48_ELEEL
VMAAEEMTLLSTSLIHPSPSTMSLPLSDDSNASTQDCKEAGRHLFFIVSVQGPCRHQTGADHYKDYRSSDIATKICNSGKICFSRKIFVHCCVCMQDGWEVVACLREATTNVQEPIRKEGLLFKKRKWPMKGWHKRYFLLDKGILMYGKTLADLKKGKVRGRIDVGLSVVSIKKKTMCIDLDTGDSIYHLKVKPLDVFDDWVLHLRNHRVFRQNEIVMDPPEHQHYSDSGSIRKVLTSLTNQSIAVSCSYVNLSLSSWADLSECESCLLELNLLLKNLEVIHRSFLTPTIDNLQFMSKLKNPLCSYNQDVCEGPCPLLYQVSSENRGSVPESLSEFFDAKEYLLSSSSSEIEVSDNDSCLSDGSDNVSEELCDSERGTERDSAGSSVSVMARRSQLPSPCMGAGVNLWNILSSNIGKDLSKVAMPVQLNEPINTLQRLCEEMEYCHLLDTAAHTHDPYMRMVYVAAFAVSAYACTYTRAGGKPFNPVLGETYECERPDKGFRFISEQVSHHPPVSACHCESKNFTLWQDVRWKNKFWGKSMEIVPMGTTHIVLPRFADHYELSRVTSCIHNILSGQRWIEQYGDVTIRNTSATEDPVLCKITFLKATVTDSEGHVIHLLFGKWHEAFYLGDPSSAICLWRANPLPLNYEKYYGFTQFTIELNDLDESIRPFLPPTDTRFRPDQRLLEEGDVTGAEEQKKRIEALQRESKRIQQENNTTHTPRFFKWTEKDSWTSNGTYWELRKDPGFSKLEFPVLW